MYKKTQWKIRDYNAKQVKQLRTRTVIDTLTSKSEKKKYEYLIPFLV